MDQEDRLALTADETGQTLGIGRTKTYQLIASGELPSIRIGTSVRVPVAALRTWIKRKSNRKLDDR